MRRSTLDSLLSSAGAMLTVALVVAGSLMMWGYTFANSNVHSQLAAQKIFFPQKGSEALAPPEIGKYLNKYAGQQLVDGRQAQTYADHFIAVHLKGIGQGQTYSQVSAQAQANPTDTKLAAQVQTLFRGETLRGMLLDAYAFWKLGQLALIGSIVSFSMGGIMLILTLLGFRHLRRVSRAQEGVADLSVERGAA